MFSSICFCLQVHVEIQSCSSVWYGSCVLNTIHGARKQTQNACLSSFCLSHFLSFNGLSAPRSLSGRGGHKTPSITSDLRSMASFRALILGFRHLPSTKVGLASCWSFNTTSGILRAIADTCAELPQTLIHTCHESRCGLLKSPTHTDFLDARLWSQFDAYTTPSSIHVPDYSMASSSFLQTWTTFPLQHSQAISACVFNCLYAAHAAPKKPPNQGSEELYAYVWRKFT